jgi:hypothetical protein
VKVGLPIDSSSAGYPVFRILKIWSYKSLFKNEMMKVATRPEVKNN